MTQLRKEHLPYYYTEEKTPKGVKRTQHSFLNRRAFLLQQKSRNTGVAVWPYSPNGEFPVRNHDRRDFLPKKGKKRNMTHTRIKRRRKHRA